MEEVLIERTIKVLTVELQAKLVETWERQNKSLKEINPSREDDQVPFEVEESDFFRYSLEERPTTKNYRFIVSCQREILDSTDRGMSISEYETEIVFLYDFGYDKVSRYYIPLRVREAISKTIQENFRKITRQSSHITPHNTAAVETANGGDRMVITGISYKIVV